jgi:hypothetical protein
MGYLLGKDFKKNVVKKKSCKQNVLKIQNKKIIESEVKVLKKQN